MAKDWAQKHQQTLFWVGIGLLIVFIYYPLISTDPISNRDDASLLGPLMKVTSITEYAGYFKSNANLDFQPVRDISYLIDLRLAKLSGFGFHHFTNVIIWLLIGLALSRLFKLYGFSQNSIYIALFIFLLHPSFSMIVSWISARKHLLAFLFIVLTWIFWKQQKSIRSIFLYNLFFILAGLSNPIILLFPFWLLVDSLLDKRELKEFLHLLPLLILSIGLLLLTYFHYQHIFAISDRSQDLALLNHGFNGPILMLKATGRYFYQLILPFRLVITYNDQSPLNWVGLGMLAIFSLFSFKVLGAKESIRWIILAFLSLSLILFKIRNIFISDTYLLLPGLALCLWCLRIWQTRPLQVLPGPILIMAAVFCFKTSAQVKTWKSDMSMWKNAFETERTCQSAHVYTMLLFKAGQNQKAVEVGDQVIKEKCIMSPSSARELFDRVLFFHQKIGFEQKEDYFRKQAARPQAALMLGILYMGQGHLKQGKDIVLQVLENPKVKFENIQKDTVFRRLYHLCYGNINEQCTLIIRILNQKGLTL